MSSLTFPRKDPGLLPCTTRCPGLIPSHAWLFLYIHICSLAIFVSLDVQIMAPELTTYMPQVHKISAMEPSLPPHLLCVHG